MIKLMIALGGNMKKNAFNNEKYLRMQSEKILERIQQYNNKLYLEFGGKIFDDYHASRILPGFEIDTKVKMLCKIKEQVEILIVINANHIQSSKIRADIGITYENEVLRMIENFERMELYVGSVVITHYEGQVAAKSFRTKLMNMNIKVYLHYTIQGYPTNIDKIIGEEGFGKNDYVETTKSLVVVTAPGPCSGKMATCLSQLYHENKRGVLAVYAKYETFPIWNLPLRHPVNLAYESATADLNDVNMIDPFHLEAYNTLTVNYNRDVEVFPVLQAVFNKIYGYSPYKSPTDMGVNMAGFCIEDEEMVVSACKQEIIRRYLDALVDLKNGKNGEEVSEKIALIMNHLNISISDRKVVKAALEKEEISKVPSIAIELSDGVIVTGKTTPLLDASAAAILNAIKHFSQLKKEVLLISPNVIEPIQDLKEHLLSENKLRLNAEEILISLAITATTNPVADLALRKLPLLKGAQAHSTVMLSYSDKNVFKKLSIDVTCEAVNSSLK